MKRGKIIVIILALAALLALGIWMLSGWSPGPFLNSPRSLAPPTSDVYLEAASWSALESFEKKWSDLNGGPAGNNPGSQLREFWSPHPVFAAWVSEPDKYGIDLNRPLGAVIRLPVTEHENPAIVYFIPVANGRAFSRALGVSARKWNNEAIAVADRIFVAHRDGYVIASVSDRHVNDLLALRDAGVHFTNHLADPLLSIFLTPHFVRRVAEMIGAAGESNERSSVERFGAELIKRISAATDQIVLEFSAAETVRASLTMLATEEHPFLDIFEPGGQPALVTALDDAPMIAGIRIRTDAARSIGEELLRGLSASTIDSAVIERQRLGLELLGREAGTAMVGTGQRIVVELIPSKDVRRIEAVERTVRDQTRATWESMMHGAGLDQAVMREIKLPSARAHGVDLHHIRMEVVLDPDNRDNPVLSQKRTSDVWYAFVSTPKGSDTGVYFVTVDSDSKELLAAQIAKLLEPEEISAARSAALGRLPGDIFAYALVDGALFSESSDTDFDYPLVVGASRIPRGLRVEAILDSARLPEFIRSPTRGPAGPVGPFGQTLPVPGLP